jgi:RNA 2',3'-cyclic 3'-phosphodiesterase
VRLFVAIDPPAVAQDHLAAATAGLAVTHTGTRVTARALWHVTLAFIGDVPDERLDAAAGALDAAVAGQSPVPLRIAGGGRFGRGKFTVLWAGVEGDLVPLRKAVARELRRARLPYDAKRFHPHLTIARPGDRLPRESIDADVAALKGYDGPQWTVAEIRLVRSYLGPQPRYETLHVAGLSQPTSPVTRPTPPDPDRPGRPAGRARRAG